MQKKLKKNYIYNLIYQILVVITPIITTPYLSRILKPTGVGYISFVESIISYFVLFAALGTSIYGIREISYLQDKPYKRTVKFYEVFIFKLVVSFIVLFIYLSLALFYFKSNIYFIFSISIISVTFDVNYFFQGIENFFVIAIRNAIIKIIGVICIFLFVKNYNDIYIYAFIVVLINLFSNITLIPFLTKYLVKVNFKDIHPFSDVKNIIFLFLPTVAIQIYTVFDKTMIGIITKDLNENGYYEQSIKISRFLLFIITALTTVIVPRISYYFKNNKIDLLKSLIYKSYKIVLFLSFPLTFGMISISNIFIPWFLGDSYTKSIYLTNVLSLIMIAIGISNITGNALMIPIKKQKEFTISIFLGAIINFVLNLFLIYKYKSIGASIASVIAEFIVTFSQIYFVRDYVDIKKVFLDAKNIIIATMFMFIITFYISHNISFFNFPLMNIIIITLVGVIIYLVILKILNDEILTRKFFDDFQ